MPRSIESAVITGGMWLALSCSAVFAQSGDWRDQRINGSSEAGFESSIAALQNSLPRRRREDLDIALALLWMTDSLGSAGLDLDHDGHVARVDMRLLADRTKDLLADIERGDLLMSIDKRATNSSGGYTTANYLRQFDGLRYDEVLDLAGRPARVSPAALRRAGALQHQRQNPGGFNYGDTAFQGLIHGGVTRQ